MSSLSYTKEKLFEAVSSLASEGALNSRLTFAAMSLVHLRGSEIVDELRGRVIQLRAFLTQTPLTSHNRYLDRELTADQSQKAATEILDLFVEAMGGL